MALVWYPLGLVGILALVLGWSAAIVVYATAPHRPVNRWLALVLAMESTGVGLARGINAFVDDPVLRWSFSSVTALMLILGPFAYLAFYSRLDSRLARVLRTRAVLWTAAAATLAGVAYYILNPLRMMDIYFAAFRLWAGFGLVGLLVALTIWRESRPGSMTRRQAKAYTLAFGVRDVGWAAYIFWIFPTFGASSAPAWRTFFAVFAPSITLAFVLLLAYGILKTQMLDIDLRIKRGLRGSTVAAAFVAVFFAVSEGAASFFESRTGSAVAGITAAALLVFALAPLQRAAERVADAAMPHVRDSAEYRLVRQRELYRAAVESASADGRITDAERNVLATLADQLGLSAREALDLEREATRGRSDAPESA